MNKFTMILLLFLTFFTAKAVESSKIDSPIFKERAIKKPNPIRCKTGIYIKTIKINQPEEEFDILFYWWIRVDSIDIYKDYKKVKEIEFINSSSDIEVSQEITNSKEKYYYINGTCKASFSFKADFHDFPYDTQNLVVSLENNSYNSDEVKYYRDDKNAYMNVLQDNNIDIMNGDHYSISKLSCMNTSYIYKTNFGDPQTKGNEEYSRINFHIEICRNPMGIMSKLALPLFVVLILSYLVFFIPDYEIGTASALTVTSLLAAIAFQWTISDSLPKVSYYTLVDKIFYLVYSFIFYAMMQTVITFNLSEGSEKIKKISNRIEFHSRWLFPLAFILILLFILN